MNNSNPLHQAPPTAPSGVRQDIDPLRTVADLAPILRMTPDGVRKMHQRGLGPRAAKIGGRIMFRESDVKAWIDAQFDANPDDSEEA